MTGRTDSLTQATRLQVIFPTALLCVHMYVSRFYAQTVSNVQLGTKKLKDFFYKHKILSPIILSSNQEMTILLVLSYFTYKVRLTPPLMCLLSPGEENTEA